jgi:hypothetical protein
MTWLDCLDIDELVQAELASLRAIACFVGGE